MAKLLYQGHGSYRFTTNKKKVIYVDPFAGTGYDEPADIVIITHEHSDHNNISLITLNDGGVILRSADLLKGGKYMTYEFHSVKITGVPAYNLNHDPKVCVGVILEFDGKKIYCSGDTSLTSYMTEVCPKLNLDYCLLPTDGVYNMDAQAATRCAEIINAKYAIPVHTKVGVLFDDEIVKGFTPKNKLIMHPGDSITLK